MTRRLAVADALSNERFRVGKLTSSEYKVDGPFPIIDQGQRLIAGYTDREDLVYEGPLPVVIFGDHSRTVKFVDVPFVAGADGTKVLVPNCELFDPQYFYYSLLALDIPSRGYNRHWAVLRNMTIPRPSLDEQEHTAEVLATIHKAEEATLANLEAARTLRVALRTALFASQNWPEVALGNVASISSGGTPSRSEPKYWGGDIPWVKTGEIDYRVILATGESITKMGLDNSSARVYPSGTILLAMYGDGVTRGKAAVLGIDAAINQACAAIVPDDRLNVNFLYQYLARSYQEIRDFGHGAHQKNLSGALLKRITVPIPSIAEQVHIAELLTAADSRSSAEEHALQALKALFRSSLDAMIEGREQVA
jgi:type I restriction enzyme S subunit